MSEILRVSANEISGGIKSGVLKEAKQPSVVVYGHAGCGKTTNAQRLARKYGCVLIIDDYQGCYKIPPNGALVLTTETPPFKSGAAAVPYEEAMEEVNV